MQLSRNGKPYRLYRPGLPDDGRTRRGGPPVPLVRLGPEGAVLPDEQYAEEALYIGDRRQVAALLRAGKKARYADKDVERILRSYIAPAPEAEAAGKPGREVHVVGGDYFSQAQYKGVGRADDNIFTRFAVRSSPTAPRTTRPARISRTATPPKPSQKSSPNRVAWRRRDAFIPV